MPEFVATLAAAMNTTIPQLLVNVARGEVTKMQAMAALARLVSNQRTAGARVGVLEGWRWAADAAANSCRNEVAREAPAHAVESMVLNALAEMQETRAT